MDGKRKDADREEDIFPEEGDQGSGNGEGSNFSDSIVVAKKARTEIVLSSSVSAAAESNPNAGAIVSMGPPRSSKLLAPVMQLSGHGGEIFAVKFSPQGDVVASAGFDRQIFLWNTFGNCENFAALTGHDGAILDLCWDVSKNAAALTGGELPALFSCSSDKTAAMWDANVGQRVRRFRGHTQVVNAIDVSRFRSESHAVVATASDDRTVKLWDPRHKSPASSIECEFAATAVCWNGLAQEQLVTGGIDNTIHVWDVRTGKALYDLKGHKDTITSLRLSPDGKRVLSCSMDNTIRTWDTQPFASSQSSAKEGVSPRALSVYMGAQHNFEKNLIKTAWSPSGKQIVSGSADRNVYVWEASTSRILYALPGHKGSVNAVDFHPTEPIIASGSSDKNIFLGELHL